MADSSASPTTPQNEEHALFFVRVWAEAVLREVARVRDTRRRAAVNDRNYERMEDWSPTEEDLDRDFREQWAQEHTLVWAAFQLEQWRARLHKERGIEPDPEHPLLRTMRNALEHLVDAQFVDERAESPAPTGKEGSALRQLKGLDIALGGEASFGHIDPAQVEAAALNVVRSIERDLEQEAIDRYVALLDEDGAADV
ncbi:hypothetical protein FE633_13080 [Streptomyces montanus]|uniref:Uncharacterized protein n=1 Tax=Streptomyces montanus TaxID=2580423 RepID=A0A5R9FUK1_9ACTN|nr:hypothetical protein [Streptomyces montanus]TLS45696.1 hypothetical protein FE633_13080 [Streptomyces montanus]